MFPVERVPEKIGAYSVLKYVGRSGLADVYVARMEGPLGFNRVVTLKIVRYALEDDARLAEELAREAAICSRLNHPAVMRMFDFFEHERRLVLVLEQAEGTSLAKLTAHLARRKQKLADAAILYIAVEIAQALAHAHASLDEGGAASPVIHRNVSPENVYIAWDGRIKLAGFGLGKIIGQTPDSVAGTVSGTPGYMAPEQARGERATARSDVYGLGALMWSLYANTEPTSLEGDVMPTRAGAPKRVEQLPSIASLRPDIPREIAAAIDAALEPSPERRRISCHDIAQWAAKLGASDRGRDDLRQRMLSLKSTREAIDAPRPAPRPAHQRTRRRQVSVARASLRRSALVGSSFPAPPSSRAAPPSTRTGRLQSSPPERGRLAPSDPARRRPSDAPSGVRIPPPPPLPKEPAYAQHRERTGGSKPAGAMKGSNGGFRTPTSPGMPRPQIPTQPLAETMRPALPMPPPPPSRVRAPSVPVARGDSAAAREMDFDMEELAMEELRESTEQSVAPRFGPHPRELARADRHRSAAPLSARPEPPLTVRPISVIPPNLHKRSSSSTRAPGLLDHEPSSIEPVPTPREPADALRSRQALDHALERDAELAAEERAARASAAKAKKEDNPISNAPTRIRANPVTEERRVELLGGADPLNEPTPTSAELPARGDEEDVRVSEEIEISLDPGGRSGAKRSVRPHAEPYRIRGRDSRERRSSSLWITLLTAALVVAVGVLILQKTWKTEPGAPTGEPAQQAKATPTAAPTQAVVTPTPTAPSTAASSAPIASASAAPAASSSADLTNLTPDQGMLTVNGPPGYLVYVHGRGVGPTNQPNVAPCGQRFLRLALPSSPKLPIWVGRGQTVVTKCMGETTVTYDLGIDAPPPLQSPFKGPRGPAGTSPL